MHTKLEMVLRCHLGDYVNFITFDFHVINCLLLTERSADKIMPYLWFMVHFCLEVGIDNFFSEICWWNELLFIFVKLTIYKDLILCIFCYCISDFSLIENFAF